MLLMRLLVLYLPTVVRLDMGWLLPCTLRGIRLRLRLRGRLSGCQLWLLLLILLLLLLLVLLLLLGLLIRLFVGWEDAGKHTL